MNNAIYFPGGFRSFKGEPTVRVWQVARGLSRVHGHAYVITGEKVTYYQNGKRFKKKLNVMTIS